MVERPPNSPLGKKQEDIVLQNFDNFPQSKTDFFIHLVSKIPTEGIPDLISFTWDLQLGVLDWLQFRLSSVYYGEGVPKGRGAIVIVPGFATAKLQYTDTVVCLKRLGYDPKIYPAKFFLNIQSVEDQIEDFGEFLAKIKDSENEKIAVIGHSIGGLIILATYFNNPKKFKEQASQIFFVGSPFPVESVNLLIGGLYLGTQAASTSDDFRLLRQLKKDFYLERFEGLRVTSIAAKDDPIIRGKSIGAPKDQFMVSGSHSGLLLNPKVLEIIAERLAEKREVKLAA